MLRWWKNTFGLVKTPWLSLCSHSAIRWGATSTPIRSDSSNRGSQSMRSSSPPVAQPMSKILPGRTNGAICAHLRSDAVSNDSAYVW